MTRPRVLVLGASGMLGHVLLRWLSRDPRVDAVGYARAPGSAPACCPVVTGDLSTDRGIDELVARVHPDVAINCIGIVKQAGYTADALAAINTDLPHRLARACAAIPARLIHISTDCVFSGARGAYREDDTPDPIDAYGRSKLAGEPAGPGILTLRTSIVGPELGTARGLLGWFLATPERLDGFTRARFSGMTTLELARVISDHVVSRPALGGLYHIAGPAITKHDLLHLFARAYRPGVTIAPVEEPAVDRTLDGGRFADATGWHAPPWREMVEAMRGFG